MSTVQNITTAEQLLAAGDIGRCELISGELHMMTPAGYDHARIAHRISFLVDAFNQKKPIGVFLGEVGCILSKNPDTVRVPDAAFVSAGRMPQSPHQGYFVGAPDLVVEVTSPDDRVDEVSIKVEEWLAAGCRLLWVVHPKSKTMTVFTPDRTARLLNAADTLDGGEVLPGLRIPVQQIFE